MRFTTFLALFGAAGAMAAAIIEPAAAPSSLAIPEHKLDVELGLLTEEDSEDAQLGKRATEGLHFVNCQGGGYAYSLIVYCANDSNCNRQPTADNQCFMSSSGLFTWEGRTNAACGFTSGVTFYYTLPANAGSRPPYTLVGSAHNAYHEYNVFKDDFHVMWTAGNGAVCKSIYYVLQK